MCNGTPFTVEKISPRVRIEFGPLDQKASASPTELPGLLTHQRINIGHKQITNMANDESEMRTRQKRIVTPGEPQVVKQYH